VYNSFLRLSGFLLFIIVLIGCGDVEPQKKPLEPEVAEIRLVLQDRWKKGYETEDLELYMSSFWEENYFYWSDMATDDDVGDDVIFDEWEEERNSAIKVFKNYRNIEIEISEPPEVKFMNEDKTKAEVQNHYKIQLYVPEGTSMPGGYEALYAEGDNIFTFDFKDNGNGEQEWRITEWRQNEFTEEEINTVWSMQ